MIDQRRLLLVHAHPDDESSQSPVTMAKYVAEGAQVTLVTCTLGEMGEILVPDWAHYSPVELGVHRQQEVAEALAILGVTDHVYLGGPGRYHDSGMLHDDRGLAIPPSELPDGAFWNADLLEAADHLVELIRDRRPQVVTTYDPFGGYGHPDHINAHRTTMYAVALAGAPSHRPDLGAPWQVQRVLWSTHDPRNWREAILRARAEGLDVFGDWDPEDAEHPRFALDPAHIAAVIPFGEYADVATRALHAHRSQVDATGDFWRFFAIARSLPGAGEVYLYAGGTPFPESDTPADDLFAGLT